MMPDPPCPEISFQFVVTAAALWWILHGLWWQTLSDYDWGLSAQIQSLKRLRVSFDRSEACHYPVCYYYCSKRFCLWCYRRQRSWHDDYSLSN